MACCTSFLFPPVQSLLDRFFCALGASDFSSPAFHDQYSYLFPLSENCDAAFEFFSLKQIKEHRLSFFFAFILLILFLTFASYLFLTFPPLAE